MLLDNPAITLQIGVEDALGIVDAVLKQRNWKKFELASLKLMYVPYYFFNYDIYVDNQDQPGQMCISALDGKLEPVLISIMDEIPVTTSKDIKPETEYEIKQPQIKSEEVKDVASVRIAGEVGTNKANILISGIKLQYVPIYRVWVQLGRNVIKVDLDAISGSPLNIEKVPTREKTTVEVAFDTVEKLKTPAGWIDYSKKAVKLGGKVMGQAASAAQSETSKDTVNWLLHTRMGQYMLIIAAILLFIIFTR